MKFDVAIIGGGPSGSTCGSFLKKYAPNLSVGIFEREIFPREHVGESQLPIIGGILDEIGVWEKVEAANFPIKIGGTYRWGCTSDLWDFHFLPHGDFKNEARPSAYSGQRLETAFQVDRSVYDKILLDHARELGCEVFEGMGVKAVHSDADTIQSILLSSGETVCAKHYVDASGQAGLLRRTMGVQVEEPSALRNIAGWDYWQNAEWAVSIGNGGTRIQVMSVGYGWIWFIPIGPTRTSVGFVCPAEYYKTSGLSMKELYLKAIAEEPRISALCKMATREERFQTTKDWSFVAERMAGRNWILVGESAGFADPILSAGLSLAHMSAKEAAFTILEIERGAHTEWLQTVYTSTNRRKILQHIRFADYWYKANAHFSDLKEYTRGIAKDAGLDLDADQAFQWLGTGGFIEEDMQVGGFGTVSLGRLHQITSRLSQTASHSPIHGFNGFELNLKGASKTFCPSYVEGRVHRLPSYQRGTKQLPLTNYFALLVDAFRMGQRVDDAVKVVVQHLRGMKLSYDINSHTQVVQCLEAMVRDGWLIPKMLSAGTPINVDFLTDHAYITENQDAKLPVHMRASTLSG